MLTFQGATLPFCTVGGKCARQHVQKYLDSSSAIQRRSISGAVISAAGVNVEFDLTFEDERLNRIITYIYHPSVGYFEKPIELRSCFISIGTASKFLLWPLGKSHNALAIQRQKIERAFGRFYAAPISDMRRYMALEKHEQKVQDQVEQFAESPSWARAYLGGNSNLRAH